MLGKPGVVTVLIQDTSRYALVYAPSPFGKCMLEASWSRYLKADGEDSVSATSFVYAADMTTFVS